MRICQQARLTHLDVYKGFCILFIVFTHCNWTNEQRLRYLFPFWIDMAVPVLMVVTGYLNEIAYEKVDYSLRKAYGIRMLFAKILRFALPFLPIYILQLVIRGVFNSERLTLGNIIYKFVVGGDGPGTYYFPVMVQIVFMAPIICFVLSKYKGKGLVICFVANMLFEIVRPYIGIGSAIYRICSLRYLFVMSFGSYLRVTEKESVKDDTMKMVVLPMLMGLIGIIYLITFNYTSATPVIVTDWINTSCIAVFFIVPITVHLISCRNIMMPTLEIIGKASWDIFLLQAFYYGFVSTFVYLVVEIFVIRIIINFLVCVLLGVLYYRAEDPITRKIISIVRQ